MSKEAWCVGGPRDGEWMAIPGDMAWMRVDYATGLLWASHLTSEVQAPPFLPKIGWYASLGDILLWMGERP